MRWGPEVFVVLYSSEFPLPGDGVLLLQGVSILHPQSCAGKFCGMFLSQSVASFAASNAVWCFAPCKRQGVDGCTACPEYEYFWFN